MKPTILWTGIILVIIVLAFVPAAHAEEQYTFVKSWGSQGHGDGQFVLPWGVAVDPSGYVYVTDPRRFSEPGNWRVDKFTLDGDFEMKFGSQGTGNGQFGLDYPKGVAVDPEGNVWVTDAGRIEKFDSGGKFLAAYGSWGTGNGQFENPQDIALDSAGNVFVIDSSNDRVQKLDPNGNYLLQWGGVGWDNADGHFLFPEGIVVDLSGNVFVVDTYNHRIQKFDSQGKFLKKWGSLGSENGQFNTPGHIAVDSAGNVYVVDRWNDRVQIFDSDGNFITKIDNLEQGSKIYPYPQGIDLDPSGNVYISDAGNNRILKFSPVTPLPAGNISVTSNPSGAAIFLDGKNTGHFTPFTLPDIAEGNHGVYVTKDCYVTPDPKNVNVIAGGTVPADFTLPSTGNCIPEFPSMVVPAGVLVGCIAVVIFFAKRK
jgi:DNA-binding beta-propeller fold protein YncE